MWGNDTTKESNRAIKRTKTVHGIIEHIKKQFQKNFVPGKRIAIDESAVGFKCKIIFIIYNPKKPMKCGIRLFVLAESDS
jgi:hypothetical protein